MYQIIREEWWLEISYLLHSTFQFQRLMACLLNVPYKKFIHTQEFYYFTYHILSLCDLISSFWWHFKNTPESRNC